MKDFLQATTGVLAPLVVVGAVGIVSTFPIIA